MKDVYKKLFSVLLAFTLIFSLTPVSLPASANILGDIVEYGSYPQSKVTDAGLIASLNGFTPEPDNTVTYAGYKYLRVYFTSPINTQQATNGYNQNTIYWFKFEPVQWRVLSDTNGDLLLMSEKILDTKVYNTPSAPITWENCSLRAWMNSSFNTTAFTPEEQVRILTSSNVNEDSAAFGTEGGNDTDDRVFLLSQSEMTSAAYGFKSDISATDTARQAQGSDYSKCQGLMVMAAQGNNSFWWLRSPGQSATYAIGTTPLGWVGNSYETTNQNYVGVRPAIRVNLSTISYDVGDIVEFGSYPQSKVSNQSDIEILNTLIPGSDNNVLYEGNLYKRVYFTDYTANYTTATRDAAHSYQDDNGYYVNTVYWFKYEPVRWRVLSNTAGELFLLSEAILMPYPYNLAYNSVTWETCGLRAWLNDTFKPDAFTNLEALKIKKTGLINEDNPWLGTEGGNSTQDKLFIPGYADVTNSEYGFAENINPDTARVSQGTDYAKCCGLYANAATGESVWTLRIPGETQYTVGTVGGDGSVWNGEYYTSVHFTGTGIRPALKINLSSTLLTPVPGSGCVIDYLKGEIYGLKPGISSLAGYAEAAGGYELAFVETANGFGTGTTVKVKQGDITVEKYTVIIFGDVNGDGNITSIDAGILVNVENYAVAWYPMTDAALIKAGNINGDGNVNGIDAGIVIDVENYNRNINQTTGLA